MEVSELLPQISVLFLTGENEHPQANASFKNVAMLETLHAWQHEIQFSRHVVIKSK